MLYRDLAAQLASLIAGESDRIANAANMASLIYPGLPDLNWVGFYFAQADELVLGPFQGQPACVRISWGNGVCGAAAARAATVLVPDVHEFPGHIACDAASASELVVPLLSRGRVVGVLDLDSPARGRFDDQDRAGCERLATILLAHHPDFKGAFQNRDGRRVERLFQILKETSTPLQFGDPNRTGAGLPNAMRALGLEGGVVAAPVAADPSMDALRRLLGLAQAGAPSTVPSGAMAPQSVNPMQNGAAPVARGPAQTTGVRLDPVTADPSPAQIRDIMKQVGLL